MRPLTSSSASVCRRRVRWQGLIAYPALVVILLVWTLPLVWVLVTSVKHRTDIFTAPPTIFFKPTLSNYIFALTARPVLANLRDSLIIATAATLITLAVAVPAGYAYARLRFPLRRQLSFLVSKQNRPYTQFLEGPCFAPSWRLGGGPPPAFL